MSGILVDSSVALDLFTGDPVYCDRALSALATWSSKGDLLIDAIVYAEVSVGFSRIEELDEALDGAGFVAVPVPREALFLAGKAFLAHRRRGGHKTAPLPDFIIGAHAAVDGLPLLTRDPARVRLAYPRPRIVEPLNDGPGVESVHGEECKLPLNFSEAQVAVYFIYRSIAADRQSALGEELGQHAL